MVTANDLVLESPTSIIPSNNDIGSGMKSATDWSDSDLSKNLFKTTFDDDPSTNSSNVDIELDEAVQKALGRSQDDTASGSTDSRGFKNNDDHEMNDGEISILSDACTETSTKSAVQLRLESWKKKRPPTAEEFQKKLDAASTRRNSSMSFFAQRAAEHFAEAKATAKRLESQQESEVRSTQEKLDRKMAFASKRKEEYLNNIIFKSTEKIERIENHKSQQEVQQQSMKESLSKKMTFAAMRKEEQLQTKTSKLQDKMEKISISKSALDEKRDMEVRAVQEKVEMKLSQANMRKEQQRQDLSDKLQAKMMMKVSTSKSQLFDDEDQVKGKLTKEDLELKLSRAAQRKQDRLDDIKNKLHRHMEKVSSTKSILDEQHEADTKAIEEKLAVKLSQATDHKEYLRREASIKLQVKLDKISDTKKSTEDKLKALGQKFALKMNQAKTNNASSEHLDRPASANGDRKRRMEMYKQSSEAKLQMKKQELEIKFFLANERKQDHVDSKATKAAAYLSATYQRGLEAMKKKQETSSNADENFEELLPLASMEAVKRKEEEVSIAGEDSFILENTLPLTSIRESGEFNTGSFNTEDRSVAGSVSSSASTKSNIQLRLESWKRPTISKESLDAKLNAATSRRKLALLDVQEKVKLGSKYEKASNKMQSAHNALKDLEDKFHRKMLAATQRKEESISKTVEKATESRDKFDKRGNSEGSEKVSAMQVKLEGKLLAAFERKEKIIMARSRKAGNKASLSAEKGQSALKQKEMLMERMKAQNQNKLNSAKSRRQRLRDLEKEKREITMVRRLMSQRVVKDDDESSISSLQEKLDRKLQAATKRKENYLAAKASRAGEHVSSTSEKGLEIMKQEEASAIKSKIEKKLEAATKRKAEVSEEEQKKKEIRQKRREYALEFARQKRLEQEMITQWESKSVISERLPVVEENDEEEGIVKVEDYEEEEDYDKITQRDIMVDESEDMYDNQKMAARNMLAEEIRRANDAKKREMSRISEERREMERNENAMREIHRPEMIHRHTSAGTIGSIDTSDLCSFDEEDMSISGLSAVKEEESRTDRRKRQAALALAELDIKLSEIQLMQAILLAEEASVNGDSEFKTSAKSVTDLNNVKVTMNFSEDEQGVKKVKKHAQNFFNYTLKSAKVAQERAGHTMAEIKQKGLFKRKVAK